MLDAASSVLLLGRREVAALLDPDELVAALVAAFGAQARGETSGPASAAVPSGDGVFHAKGAARAGTVPRAVFKVNGNFPGNPERHGLPTVQGVIVLADAARGTPLALMDGMEITAQRTAAATALAAQRLAPAAGGRGLAVLIVGCGVQGWAHARFLARTLPLGELVLHDVLAPRARALAARIERELGLSARPASDLEAAARAAQVIVTCTTAYRPVLSADWITPASFVAAVGADNPAKQELEPRLLARARVVVDDGAQCATSGELRHALAAGVMKREDVAAELYELVAGTAVVRRAPEDVVVFDSTGVALEDLAAATLVYDRAVARGAGTRFDLAGA